MCTVLSFRVKTFVAPNCPDPTESIRCRCHLIMAPPFAPHPTFATHSINNNSKGILEHYIGTGDDDTLFTSRKVQGRWRREGLLYLFARGRDPSSQNPEIVKTSPLLVVDLISRSVNGQKDVSHICVSWYLLRPVYYTDLYLNLYETVNKSFMMFKLIRLQCKWK